MKIRESNQPSLLISTRFVQAPQALQLPVVQAIIKDMDVDRKLTNWTLRRVSSTDMGGTTRVLRGICGTSTSPPSGGL